MLRIVAVLLFLMLVGDEATAIYTQEHMFTPFKWLQFFFEPLPIKVRVFDLIMAGVLIYAGTTKHSKGPRVQPMRNALFLCLGTIVCFFAYGIVRGGDVRAASWQVYLMLSALLAAFTIASVCRTAEHFRFLAKVVVGAGVYRAVMLLIFYVSYVRGSTTFFPPTLTTHHDTVLWVVCVMLVLINLVESKSRGAVLWLGLLPLFFIAIQLNNRRLAWVSLAASLLIFYAAQKPSKAKRRTLQVAMAIVPIVLLYVVIGWGRPERIFKPLAAFATISTTEDASTKARNVENLGLIATSNAYGHFLSTGWGHKYIEVSSKYSIREAFELWPYVPHNSVLGLFAFTGYVGFIGFWMMIPTAVFLHARTAKQAQAPLDRAVGIAGIVQIAVCCNQMFGDMGTFSPTTMYMLATSMAAAMRIPAESGVWVTARAAVKPAASNLAPPPQLSSAERAASAPEAAWRS